MKFDKINAEIVIRVIAAIFGGYLITNLISIVLSALLPFSRSENLLTVLLFSFVIYTIAVIWAFAADSAKKAWLGL